MVPAVDALCEKTVSGEWNDVPMDVMRFLNLEVSGEEGVLFSAGRAV